MELLAPRAVGRLIGVRPHRFLLRMLGLREIATGVGLLTQSEKAPWLKARVAGDAMDLGLLGLVGTSKHSGTGRVLFATSQPAGRARSTSRKFDELVRA